MRTYKQYKRAKTPGHRSTRKTSNNIVTSILPNRCRCRRHPQRGAPHRLPRLPDHGEIPGICYVIYGRNASGRLAELGSVSDFPAAMRWVDRHLAQLRRILPVHDSPLPGIISDAAPETALRQAA